SMRLTGRQRRNAGAHFLQSAQGRLLSAAREPAPTLHLVRAHHEPSFRPRPSGLRAASASTLLGAGGRKVSMPRRVTSASSLENLRKEAKRWLMELRAGDADARLRLERAYPAAPANPALRDVQHALAHAYDQE